MLSLVFLGLQKQKGIITYGISPNRQNPFAGAGHDAVFNVWRRFYAHVFYWAPPMLVTYYVLDWAKKRYGCFGVGCLETEVVLTDW